MYGDSIIVLMAILNVALFPGDSEIVLLTAIDHRSISKEVSCGCPLVLSAYM